jgi:DNA-binding protein H-NS
MARPKSLASLSVDALLKMRDDIGSLLSKKVGDLRRQLSALTGTDVGNGRKRGRKAHPAKGRKVAPKYKGPGGELWAGRGATPRWMAEAIKGGGKKADFAINGAAGPTKSAAKKRAKKK